MATSHRLPSLNALRAFEAVSRRLSFARAAEELFVTKAAVAQQVRLLEEEIGAPLVERSGSGPATDRSGRGGRGDARRWLCDARARREGDARGEGQGIPRHQFQRLVRGDLARRPDRQVQGAPSRDRRAGRRQSDGGYVRPRSRRCADSVGRGGVSGTFDDAAVQGRSLPGLRAATRRRRAPLARAQETSRATRCCISNGTRVFDLAFLGGLAEGRGGERLGGDPRRLFQPDVDGDRRRGAGAGRRIGFAAIAADDLASGRLVAPFAVSMRTPFGYYFLCRPAEAETPRIKALRDFLVEEAALSAG